MNKNYLRLSVLSLCLFAETFSAQQFIDKYLTDQLVYTTIGTTVNGVNKPCDLDFKPHSNELWVLNNGGGGSTVLFFNSGQAGQTSQYRKDSHAGHFMIYPSAIAFSDIGDFANTNEVQNTSHPTSTFMGPALWSADTNIYARVFQNGWQAGFPLGSHTDMLHQSPFSMGIAHDSAKVYWVFDGHNGNLCKYDFVMDHGPGYDNHSNGKIWRYTDIALVRVANVPSHMVLDKNSKWLYIVDGGTKSIIRVNTKTGTVGNNIQMPNTGAEYLALYKGVTGATKQVIDTWSSQPSGIDCVGDRLIVGDYQTGDIRIYNTAAVTPTLMGTIATGQPGIMGVKIGYDGRIWFVNNTQSKVVRIDRTPLTTDASIDKVIFPALENFEKDFHTPFYNQCGTTVAPVVTLRNEGSSTLSSVNIIYKIDGGAATSFGWTGSLSPNATTTVNLPAGNVSAGAHKLEVYTSLPNNVADQNSMNDKKEGAFRNRNSPLPLPFHEDFGNAFPPSGWEYLGFNMFAEMSINQSFGGHNASLGCLQMDNVSGGVDITGQTDYLISPLIDLSTTGRSELTFDVAYAQYSSSSADSLIILISKDCGNTWTKLYANGGASLSTAAPSASVFVPEFWEWRSDSVELGHNVGSAESMIMIKTISNFGNMLYLDNIHINFDNTKGIKETEKGSVKVYPSPSNGQLNIESEQLINKIVVVDLLGAVVFEKEFNEKLQNKTLLDLTSLNNGTYFLVTMGEQNFTRRIVIQK